MNKDPFKTAKPLYEDEKEYDVKVSACFSVMAKSRKEAEYYILEQFDSGNTSYTDSIEIDI